MGRIDWLISSRGRFDIPMYAYDWKEGIGRMYGNEYQGFESVQCAAFQQDLHQITQKIKWTYWYSFCSDFIDILCFWSTTDIVYHVSSLSLLLVHHILYEHSAIYNIVFFAWMPHRNYTPDGRRTWRAHVFQSPATPRFSKLCVARRQMLRAWSGPLRFSSRWPARTRKHITITIIICPHNKITAAAVASSSWSHCCATTTTRARVFLLLFTEWCARVYYVIIIITICEFYYNCHLYPAEDIDRETPRERLYVLYVEYRIGSAHCVPYGRSPTTINKADNWKVPPAYRMLSFLYE